MKFQRTWELTWIMDIPWEKDKASEKWKWWTCSLVWVEDVKGLYLTVNRRIRISNWKSYSNWSDVFLLPLSWDAKSLSFVVVLPIEYYNIVQGNCHGTWPWNWWIEKGGMECCGGKEENECNGNCDLWLEWLRLITEWKGSLFARGGLII